MKPSNAPGRIFNDAFKAILATSEPLGFEDGWRNGTGYFDNAIKVKLEPGEMKVSYDPIVRRMLFIGTRFGTIVVFDRFPDQVDGGVYVCNKPRNAIIEMVTGGSALGESEMLNLCGGWGNLKDNIGFKIEQGLSEQKPFED